MKSASDNLLQNPRGYFSGISAALRQKNFWVLWAPQFSVFFFLLLFYTYGFMALPSVCVLLSVFFLSISCTLFMLRKQAGRYALPVSMILPVAVLAGSVGGLYTYDVYAVYPMFYQNARIYTDVLPSQSSAAVADGGKLVFASGSYVDPSHSVGYVTERGSIYCVAPVRDASSEILKVEFWAVGISCCSMQGNFTCDASQDKSALGGAIIFDNGGFFSHSNYWEFTQARHKAEATYGLYSPGAAKYVRWVSESNLDSVAMEFEWKTIATTSIWTFLYGGMSLGLAYVLQKYMKPMKPSQASQALQGGLTTSMPQTSGGTFS